MKWFFTAKADVIGALLSIALGLCLSLWLIPAWVEPDADLRLPVALLPQIVAMGFIGSGVALLLRSLFVARRIEQSEFEHAAVASVNDDFAVGEWRGVLAMIAILLIATIGFDYLHFLVVAPLLVAASMWMYGPVRPLGLVLTSTIGPLLIWLLGTQVLGRVLP